MCENSLWLRLCIVALFAIEMQSKAVGRRRNVKRQTVGGVEINRPDEN